MDINLNPGIEGKKEMLVTVDKTAATFGSGSLEVLASPAMIALMEQTAMESVDSLLPEAWITVGTEVSIKHFKATLPGKVVSCSTLLVRVEGKRLFFEVAASDETGLIGKGTHTRYIVDKQLFIDNISDK